MQPGDLPQFKPGENYVLTGDTLNAIMNYLKEKTIVIVQGSGLKTDEVGPDGTKISVDLGKPGATGAAGFSTIDLDVCVNGSPETHTFVIADAS